MYEQLISGLCDKVQSEHIVENAPMSEHTSFKIGGPARVLVEPSCIEEVAAVVEACKLQKLPYHIMGNGSNLLVSDKGYKGVMIKIGEKMNGVSIQGNLVKAQAGILLSNLSGQIVKASLKGFEFASGIPGTLGGAVFMNAGAYGGEMKDIVKSVVVLDENGGITTLNGSELEFGYRTSIIQKRHLVVLEVELELEVGDPAEIKATIDDLTGKRTSKQPLHLPSAGSTFKRPEGYYAGKLIEDSGLKGLRHGGAQVSDKHCGFVVNVGGATSADVRSLIATVQKVVMDRYNVKLEPEVRMLGEE